LCHWPQILLRTDTNQVARDVVSCHVSLAADFTTNRHSSFFPGFFVSLAADFTTSRHRMENAKLRATSCVIGRRFYYEPTRLIIQPRMCCVFGRRFYYEPTRRRCDGMRLL